MKTLHFYSSHFSSIFGFYPESFMKYLYTFHSFRYKKNNLEKNNKISSYSCPRNNVFPPMIVNAPYNNPWPLLVKLSPFYPINGFTSAWHLCTIILTHCHISKIPLLFETAELQCKFGPEHKQFFSKNLSKRQWPCSGSMSFHVKLRKRFLQ